MFSINNKDFAVKLAIMYIIDKYETAASDDILTNIAIEVCEINYFIFKQCEFELAETGFIHKFSADGEELYMLTEKGNAALEVFRAKLPYTIRTKITEKIVNYMPEKYNRNTFECFALPVNDVESNVMISYKDGKNIIMQLQIFAGSDKQAKQVVEAVKANRDKVFDDIYKYFFKLKPQENDKQQPQIGENN